jgi:hypothetical protein
MSEQAPADGFADALSQSLYGNDPAAVACAMQYADDVDGDSTDAVALRRLAEEVRRLRTVGNGPLHEWKESDWAFDFQFLERIRAAGPRDCFMPSLEGIECSLLGYEQVTGRRLAEPSAVVNQSLTTGAAHDRTQLHGALVRVVLEAEGCPPPCSHEFHRMAIASIVRIAKDALNRTLSAPHGHDEAQVRIAQCIREIEVIADEFGYDPAQWLVTPPEFVGPS